MNDLSLDEVAKRGQLAWKFMMASVERHYIPNDIYFWNAEWLKYNDMIKEGKYK